MFEYDTDPSGTDDPSGRDERSGSDVPSGSDVACSQGLGQLAATVEMLAGEDLAGLGSVGRDDRVVVLARVIERARAELVRSVGSWDVQGDWGVDGSLSPAASLTSRTPLARRDAGRLVRAARLARDHPVVGDALHDGRVSVGQVDRLVRAERGREALFARDVDDLVEAAGRLGVDWFDRVVRRWEHLADDELDRRPPAVDPDVQLSRTTGGWFLSGGLDPEVGELLAQALEVICPPDPATREGGVRSAGRRRADGLGLLAESFLSRPVPGRVTPRLVVHVTVDALIRDRDRVPYDLTRLRADLERGGPIPMVTLDRLACDPHLVRVVFAGPGQVLDVGRASRVVTDAQRRALEARDQCCRWPGCDRPASWCDAHHIIPWARGGPTDLSNLVLLCAAHHRKLHDERWTLARDPTTGEVTVQRAGTRHRTRTHDPPEP